MSNRPERPKTPTYIFFYILFSQDTWRILAGFIISILFTPKIVPPDLSMAGRVMLHVMILAIGWAITGKPAKWITTKLKKFFLGNRTQ